MGEETKHGQENKRRVSRSKSTSVLDRNGYEAYLPFSNNSKYDVLGIKAGKIQRISIKYTSTQRNFGTWVVEMRQISRRNNSINIDKFDSSMYDIIAVYIGPKDKVILVNANKSTTQALYLKY